MYIRFWTGLREIVEIVLLPPNSRAFFVGSRRTGVPATLIISATTLNRKRVTNDHMTRDGVSNSLLLDIHVCLARRGRQSGTSPEFSARWPGSAPG